MGVSVSSANSVLKVRYARDLTRILMTDPFIEPFIARIKRKKGKMVASAVGQKFVIPIKLRDQQSASYSFSASQGKTDGATTGNASKYTAFEIPVVPGYATARVDGQAECVASGDTNAFVDLMDEEIQGALRQAQQEIAMACFKAGTGSRARILAVNASPNYVDVASADTTFFEVGMSLVAAAADGTGSLRSATALVISGIDPITGRMTLSASPVALSWSAGSGGDYLYKEGDFVADTSTKIVGLGAWCPVTVPSSGATFMGVVRDSEWKLYGLRHDASTSTDGLSAIIDATAKVRHFAKGKTTAGYMNPLDWGRLANSLEDSRRTTVKDDTYSLSFSAIEVSGMTGNFPIFPDSNVPKGLVYLVNEDDLYFIHAGSDLVDLIDTDGNTIRAKGDADSFEARARSMANLACSDPSQLCVVYNWT
jgi:hypothetical protein